MKALRRSALGRATKNSPNENYGMRVSSDQPDAAIGQRSSSWARDDIRRAAAAGRITDDQVDRLGRRPSRAASEVSAELSP
jgi:hypothetical protein